MESVTLTSELSPLKPARKFLPYSSPSCLSFYLVWDHFQCLRNSVFTSSCWDLRRHNSLCTVMLNSSCLEQSGCLLNLYVMILYSHEAIFDLSFLYTSNSDPFYSLFFFFFSPAGGCDCEPGIVGFFSVLASEQRCCWKGEYLTSIPFDVDVCS